jgi:ATPase subunit of ABC transporter with duplicated ATPase domains
MRTALACALFVEPDILLGDELTVHLDAKTVLWLEDYLRCVLCACVYLRGACVYLRGSERRWRELCVDCSLPPTRTYPKTLVLVSHDRAFLNNVVSDVIHLHNQKLEYYKCVRRYTSRLLRFLACL